MEFVWNMSQKQFEEFIKDNNSIKNGKEITGYGFYGQCKIGNLCADIQHTLDKSDWYPYSNVYALGIDDGYGKTISGIPYSLLNDSPKVIICEDFEAFKKKFEQVFEEYILSSDKRKELSKMPLGNWN